LFRRELENDVVAAGNDAGAALLDVHLGGEMPENLDAMASAAGKVVDDLQAARLTAS